MSSWLRCELFPADLDEAVAFYVQVLAFRVAREERGAEAMYVALERDQVRLSLAQRPDVPDRDHRRPPVGVSSCWRSRISTPTATESCPRGGRWRRT